MKKTAKKLLIFSYNKQTKKIGDKSQSLLPQEDIENCKQKDM